MKKIYLLVILVVSAVVPSLAQQDPLYAQYFNNPMLINPAFAGMNKRLYTAVAYRSQWSGVDGRPVSFNLNSHIALVDNKVGAGIIAVQDKLGDITNTQYSGVFSYHITLPNDAIVSMGLQAGFYRFATDPNAVKILNNPDPAFNQYSETKFNTGAGALIQSERYTIGLSVPRMLPSKVDQGGQSIQVYGQNYYLFGSYMFYASEKVHIKPSALLRATSNTPISLDVNCNIVFNNLYTAGIFTRKLNTYGLLLQMVMKNYRLGYVFEVPGKSSAINAPTHEVSLAMSLDVLTSHDHISNGL